LVGNSGLENVALGFEKSAFSAPSDRTFRDFRRRFRKTTTPKAAATPSKVPATHPSTMPVLAPVLRPGDLGEADAVTVVNDMVLGLVVAEAEASELLGMDEEDNVGFAVEPIPQVVGERFGSCLLMVKTSLPFPNSL